MVKNYCTNSYRFWWKPDCVLSLKFPIWRWYEPWVFWFHRYSANRVDLKCTVLEEIRLPQTVCLTGRNTSQE